MDDTTLEDRIDAAIDAARKKGLLGDHMVESDDTDYEATVRDIIRGVVEPEFRKKGLLWTEEDIMNFQFGDDDPDEFMERTLPPMSYLGGSNHDMFASSEQIATPAYPQRANSLINRARRPVMRNRLAAVGSWQDTSPHQAEHFDPGGWLETLGDSNTIAEVDAMRPYAHSAIGNDMPLSDFPKWLRHMRDRGGSARNALAGSGAQRLLHEYGWEK